MAGTVDCIELTRDLIRCPSVTPAEGGALTLLQERLEPLGFACHRLVFEETGFAPVDNLYARLGDGGPNLCYAGHTDVVPVGDTAAWSCDPFAAELRDGVVIGRGAVDMKGSIAAFVAAAAAFLENRDGAFDGSISLLITGDEEADAVNGTRKVLDWLAERGEKLDACLVGEPTSAQALGDTVKIGRRGSLTGKLTLRGTQGHTAYPQLADNPLHHLVRLLDQLARTPLDDGSTHFPPSSLQLTTIDCGNPASNVIPAEATAAFNIRFNDHHSGAVLEQRLRDLLVESGCDHDLSIRISGESFLCPPGPFSDLVCRAVAQVTGESPELSTTGGTSDARFIKDHAPVAELGLLNATAHKVDEQVPLEHLERLTAIYLALLKGYFAP
ncbi:MAG: succinyl-diaminopimelate desuccinylase [Pseudomonadota bacterium]